MPSIRIIEKFGKGNKKSVTGYTEYFNGCRKKKRNRIQSNFMQWKENSNRELFAKVITAFHIQEVLSVVIDFCDFNVFCFI